MINVYIKSFNRAYYLDRCLFSIFKHLKGQYKVYVLDDGTPLRYLNKLRTKYPSVEFRDSPEADTKRKQIECSLTAPEENISKIIPLLFWRKQIETGTDIFLLWEDDIWLTDEINVDDYAYLMKENAINLIKVRWWGNENTNVGKRIVLNSQVERIVPNLHWLAEYMVKNKYFIHSLAMLLHLIKDTYFLQLYTYYEVAGVFFDKRYWLYLWPKELNKIEEMIQLGKAAEWARIYPKTLFCKCIKEKGHSTYLTSSAGTMNEKDDFSMSRVNHYLNEAWYDEKLNSLECFPLDFTVESFYKILEIANDRLANPDKWKIWSNNFKQHFEDIGCSALG